MNIKLKVKSSDVSIKVEETCIYKLAFNEGYKNPNKDCNIPIIFYGAPPHWGRPLKIKVWTEAFLQGQIAARIK